MLSSMGCIEVVEDLNPDGKVVDRIVCLPVETILESEEEIYASGMILDDLEDAEGVEVVDWEKDEESYFSNTLLMNNPILDTILFYGCGGCQHPCNEGPCHPRGILKKSSHDKSNLQNAVPLNQNRNVSFSSLEIKEFNMTLGNHPSATSGPPVMLDWDSELNKRVVNLDEYEQMRSPRRQRRQLKLSYRDRKGILEEQRGFSTEEVNEAWAEALKIRQQRHETLRRGMVLMTLDDVVESAQRKYRRIVETLGLA